MCMHLLKYLFDMSFLFFFAVVLNLSIKQWKKKDGYLYCCLYCIYVQRYSL